MALTIRIMKCNQILIGVSRIFLEGYPKPKLGKLFRYGLSEDYVSKRQKDHKGSMSPPISLEIM